MPAQVQSHAVRGWRPSVSGQRHSGVTKKPRTAVMMRYSSMAPLVVAVMAAALLSTSCSSRCTCRKEEM